MKIYFAKDGNYGDATDLVLIDSHWFSEEDWEVIEQASDMERANVAMKLQREERKC